MDTQALLLRIIDLLSVGFFIGAPILSISTVAQWLTQFRLIPNHNVPVMLGLRCILYTQLSAYLLSLVIWILWPLDPQLIMYNDRISIPCVMAELIAIPFWLNYFGYFKKEA